MKVGLFIPCYINAVYPEVGVAAFKLLKQVGVDVDYPLDQTCCGQPMATAGFENEATRLAVRKEDLFHRPVVLHLSKKIIRIYWRKRAMFVQIARKSTISASSCMMWLNQKVYRLFSLIK